MGVESNERQIGKPPFWGLSLEQTEWDEKVMCLFWPCEPKKSNKFQSWFLHDDVPVFADGPKSPGASCLTMSSQGGPLDRAP